MEKYHTMRMLLFATKALIMSAALFIAFLPVEAVEVDKSIYIDTMVQFAVMEESPNNSDFAEGDKLAVWLQADKNGTTNLCVLADRICPASGKTGHLAQTTSFVLKLPKGKTVSAGNWYRLTVKAVPTPMGCLGFAISLDGSEPLTAQTVDPIHKDIVAALSDKASRDFISLASKNQLFASRNSSKNTNYNLTSADYRGSGKIDDIEFTTNNPIDDEYVDFTLSVKPGSVLAYLMEGEAEDKGEDKEL